MTTISADRATRIRPGTSRVHRASAQTRAMLAVLLLVMVALLIVDNHVMTLPGGSFADIGVASAVLDKPAAKAIVIRPGASDHPAGRSTGRFVNELHHCFVHARRSGRDPGSCRTRS